MSIKPPSVEQQDRRGASGFALFALGFRPFFLCAGFAAVAIMTVWLLGYTKRNPLLTYYGSSGWHAHEMLFGYMVAVIAGFLLTAVRNWTHIETPRGMTLAALVALWLAGRVLPVMSDIPPWLVALVDFAFLPVLTLTLAVPLLRAGRRKDLSIIALLVVLIGANALVHSEWLHFTMDTARLGVLVAIYALVLLITLIAGRVFPFFIEGGLGEGTVQQRPVIEYASVIVVIVLALADLFSPSVKPVVVCAYLAAAVHAWRWFGWFSKGVWSQPLLWVLMLGYAWLIVGFVLLGVSYSGQISHMLAFHGFMVGGFGGLTLGMMARVALGHTGRPLRVSPLVAMSFMMLNVAAVVRIAGPLSSARYSQAMIIAAGALWIISFVLFLLIYAPILMQPRVDNRPG